MIVRCRSRFRRPGRRRMIVILVGGMNMFLLFRDLRVWIRPHADRDMRPHTARRMRRDRTEVFVLAVFVGFYNDLFRLNDTVVAFGRKLRGSGRFGNTRPGGKLPDNVTEPDVVSHVYVDIDEKDRHPNARRHREDRVPDALDPIREHIVFGAGEYDQTNFLAGESERRAVFRSDSLVLLNSGELRRLYRFLLTTDKRKGLVAERIDYKH